MFPTPMRYDAFVSYSHADASWVLGELLPRLEAAGLRVCLDRRDFQIGASVIKNIVAAIEGSRHTLAVLSPYYVKGEWTGFESLLVQTNDPAARRLRLLPLLLQTCEIPLEIRSLTYADFRNGAEWDAQFARLIAAIKDEEPSAASVEEMPLDALPPIAALPTGSRMPFRPNPLFVGRQQDLLALARDLRAGGTVAVGQAAAVTGAGGIGKTQLAVEFVHRYSRFFAGGVFWLSFADAANVPTEIARCGGPEGMNLPDFADLKIDEQVGRVLALWREPVPRLLVFDNCEDEALLWQWRPPSGGSRVLLTSRRDEWSPALGVCAHPLGLLPRDKSVALLRGFRPDLPEDDPCLAAIAKELGDLPLALHLAGSHLKAARHDLSPADYLAEVRQPHLLAHESLVEGDWSPTGHDQHVARTFALSLDKLEPGDPTDALALSLLARLAYLAPGERCRAPCCG